MSENIGKGGIIFEVDASIYMLFDKIKDENLLSVVVDGKKEDFELNYINYTILAQMKSNRNTKSKANGKLKEALEKTLIFHNCGSDNLIYFVTNQLTPIKCKEVVFENNIVVEISFSELNNKTQENIKSLYDVVMLENKKDGIKYKNYDSLYILRIPYFEDDVERKFIYYKIKDFLDDCNVRILSSDVYDKIFHYFNFSAIGKRKFEKVDILFIILSRVLKDRMFDFDESIIHDMENVLNKYYYNIKVLNEIYYAYYMFMTKNDKFNFDDFYESEFLLNFKKNNFHEMINRDLFMKCLIELVLEKKEYYNKLKKGMNLNDN